MLNRQLFHKARANTMEDEIIAIVGGLMIDAHNCSIGSVREKSCRTILMVDRGRGATVGLPFKEGLRQRKTNSHFPSEGAGLLVCNRSAIRFPEYMRGSDTLRGSI